LLPSLEDALIVSHEIQNEKDKMEKELLFHGHSTMNLDFNDKIGLLAIPLRWTIIGKSGERRSHVSPWGPAGDFLPDRRLHVEAVT
jgi:hypothetical protein